jgi:hypothetical protein
MLISGETSQFFCAGKAKNFLNLRKIGSFPEFKREGYLGGIERKL